MLRFNIIRYCVCTVLLFCSTATLALNIDDPKQALEAYVNQEDGVFSYHKLASVAGPGVTVHLYNLISQQWRSSDEIDRTLWRHQLVMVVPDNVVGNTGMLFVGGGDNDDPPPDSSNTIMQSITQLALSSQTIVSAIYQVPNQPFIFPGDITRYKEDDLVSYSWDKYLDTGDTVWPIHLPMTKSVIKAMDAISQIAPTLGEFEVSKFVITGFSKRGQVAWLAAAIDPRVIAIAPGVIDFLNMVPSLENQFKSYGAYVPELNSLVELGVTDRIRTPEFKGLLAIVDPYQYRSRLGLPKLLLNSSGDQFFLPDSARFFYADLVGEKLIRYAPNTGHSLENSATGATDTLHTLLGWYQSILLGTRRPDITWRSYNGRLQARTSIAPQLVRVWRASNTLARDFRKISIGESWVAKTIYANADGQYEVMLPQPVVGFAATYIEFVYQGNSGLPMTYSTQVYITPEHYPFALNDPIKDPRLPPYWKQQLDIAMAIDDDQIKRSDFMGFLPFPVFGQYYTSLEQLAVTLGSSALFDVTAPDLVLRQCLTTRLNVKSKKLGWYSDVNLGYLGRGKVWEFYQFANTLRAIGVDWFAGYVCFKLNQL